MFKLLLECIVFGMFVICVGVVLWFMKSSRMRLERIR